MCAEEPGFTTKIVHRDRIETAAINDAFFDAVIASPIDFFRTGNVPVTPADTIKIMNIRAHCLQALETPDTWVTIGQ